MKVRCTHGFFEFEESSAGEVSDFASLTGLAFVRRENVFTFAELEAMPSYSIEGGPLLNATATETHEGTPAQVLEANGLVYDPNRGLLIPIDSVTDIVNVQAAGKVYVCDGLILPGSRTRAGDQISGYAGWFNRKAMRFQYSEVTFV